MSSIGCLKSERIPKLLDAATILLPDEERNIGGYLSLLMSTMCSVLHSMDNKSQNGSIIEIQRILEAVRKPLIDPTHCEGCRDGNDIINAIIPKLGHVEPAVAVSAMGVVIKTLLDTISDEEVIDDCITELEDTLFPDEEAETFH